MKRFLVILACLFFTASLYANPLTIRISSDSDPHSTVAGCVNALSGAFFLTETDIESKRAGGLNYYRVYDSASHVSNVIGYGWGNGYATELNYYDYKRGEDVLRVGSCEYDRLLFCAEEIQKGKFTGGVHDDVFKLGIINSPDALLMGGVTFSESTVTCLLANKSKEKTVWEVKLPDGTLRTYHKTKHKKKYTNGKLYYYRLEEERLPNGHIRHYDYLGDTFELESIRVTNADASRELDFLSFTYSKKGKIYRREIRSPTGDVACYKLCLVPIDNLSKPTKTFGLMGVTGTHLQSSDYKILGNFKSGDKLHFTINQVHKPQSRGLFLDYYENIKKISYGKVKALNVPLEEGGKPVRVYKFKYSEKHTDVFDAFGNKTTYYRANNRLAKIRQGDYRVFKYIWDSKGRLLNKGLQSIDGKYTKCNCYLYDSTGNIVEKTNCGNITGNNSLRFDLDGKGFPLGKVDRAVHKFAYSLDGMNLKTKEFLPNGTCIEYHYKPNTNLLIKKLTLFKGKVQQREFHSYDENSLLVKTITDDGCGRFDSLEGVTYRLITETEYELNECANGYTQPKVIAESYLDLETGTEKLLKKTELLYNAADLVSEKRVYDSDNEYRYSLHYEYNPRHKIIRELNAHGGETFYDYDENDNLIYQSVAGSKKQSFFKYDLLNRLVEETEKFDDGITLTTTHAYDLLGNRLTTTDPYGGITHYTYDAYGREVSQTDPLGNTIFTEYDLLDNPVKVVDKEGNCTLKKYTIDGKPYEIQYPDGTQEKFIYFIDGNLNKKWNKDGTQISYLYDYLDRITCESHYDQEGNLIKQQHYEYKGKNLIRHTDAMGIDTCYTYDSAGRLQSTITDGVEEVYTYDALGRLWKTTKENRVDIKEYDLRDRVIEQRVEDLFGNIYQKETSLYDANGNKIRGRIYADENTYSETRTVYNGQNLPIMIIDPEGNETHYLYSHKDHFEKITIDPLGKQTREVYDPLKQLISQEVTHSGWLLANEEYEYSPNGNKIRQINHIIELGKKQGTFRVEWTYDPMGNVLSQTEQETKVAGYSYLFGRLSTTTKPDGVALQQKYDSLGRISSLTSSDGSIKYTYQYDLNDNLIQVTDLNSNHSVKRTYDKQNRLIWEKQATGIEFEYVYDSQDRVQKVSWQDNDIVYGYSPVALVTASRYKEGRELYQYEQKVDWRRKITDCTLPNRTSIEYIWDSTGRTTSIHSNLFNQELYYDSCGNLIATTLNGEHTTYDYDHLYQLTNESGKFSNQYTFDSLNNRTSKNDIHQDVDHLNQLLSDSKNTYQYDLNGNRISKGNAHYTYDALGRLISYSDESSHVIYRYDPLGRCYEKQDLDTTVQYIHQFDTEIGTVESGVTKELRAIHGQFSSFAFELDNSLYFPIRNHRGDICLLLDQKGEAVATYHYDAFGVFIHEGSKASPWLFSGQRYDSATELYIYLKRYYDPEIGRWLTPDPIGFADGPNLYTYVHNNPLIYVDPYGLWRKLVDTSLYYTNEFTHGFSRGCADYATCGLSSAALGEHKSNTWTSWTGYTLGGGITFGIGLAEGYSWPRVANGVSRGTLGATQIVKGVFGFGKNVNYMNKVSEVAKMVQKSDVLANNVINTVRGSKMILQEGKPALNPFNYAVNQLSKTGQNNTRILRNWAKSKGWEMKPNPIGGPEMWGVRDVNGKFKWNLKIKPIGSAREGIQQGSQMPRFSSRIKDGKYVNPFTGETGGVEVGGHIPLEQVFY